MEQFNIEWKDIASVKPYPKNAKKHDITQIANVAESIKQFGWQQPIVCDADGVIIIGHCRLLAAKKLGLKKVPVKTVDNLSEEQVKKLRTLDNKLNESDWDFDLLAEDIGELDFSGFDIDWGIPADVEETEIVEDEAPEVDEESEPITRLGDIWQLGRHKLICGDSTDRATVERLMDGAKADMVFTDPPYGVNIRGGSKSNKSIAGDQTQVAIPFSFDLAVEVATKDDARFYFCGGELNLSLYEKLFDKYLRQLPRHIIWVKNGFTLKPNNYHNQYEIIYFGFKPKGGGADKWYSGRTEEEASDVWKIKRDAPSSYLHPTQKPIELSARAIRNSSPIGAIIYDPFGGSGSTLIACEQLDRVCYMAEIDEHYCDVIIKRWENLTGQKAVKIS